VSQAFHTFPSTSSSKMSSYVFGEIRAARVSSTEEIYRVPCSGPHPNLLFTCTGGLHKFCCNRGNHLVQDLLRICCERLVHMGKRVVRFLYFDRMKLLYYICTEYSFPLYRRFVQNLLQWRVPSCTRFATDLLHLPSTSGQVSCTVLVL
jgi:hypothetical protein